MVRIPLRNAIPFDHPATYQISVQGMIDPDWTDRLSGMTIGLITEEARPPVTTLHGEPATRLPCLEFSTRSMSYIYLFFQWFACLPARLTGRGVGGDASLVMAAVPEK